MPSSDLLIRGGPASRPRPPIPFDACGGDAIPCAWRRHVVETPARCALLTGRTGGRSMPDEIFEQIARLERDKKDRPGAVWGTGLPQLPLDEADVTMVDAKQVN